MITYIIYKIIKNRKEKEQLKYEYWQELIKGE